jgi:hypothetical protein
MQPVSQNTAKTTANTAGSRNNTIQRKRLGLAGAYGAGSAFVAAFEWLCSGVFIRLLQPVRVSYGIRLPEPLARAGGPNTQEQLFP